MLIKILIVGSHVIIFFFSDIKEVESEIFKRKPGVFLVSCGLSVFELT